MAKNGLLFQLDLIIWTLAFIVTILVALILCIPFAIYRELVKVSAKIYQPDLVKIISPSQQIIFHNDFQEHRVPFNILTWQILKSPLKLQDVQKTIQDNLISHAGPNGQLEFPEFQQYFSIYGGCVFYKWDRSFNATNHIRYLNEAQDGLITTESDLQKIISRLLSKGWSKNRSAWELLIINNYRSDEDEEDSSNKSVLIFRFHHSLADGYSYLNFMVRRLCQVNHPVNAISPPTRKLTTWEKIYTHVWSTLREPYDLVKMFKTRNKESPWSPPDGTLSKEYTVVWSKPVTVDRIKKIKSRHGVSFQAVLHSIIGGTVQSLMARAGHRSPKIMNAFVPFPAPNHSGGVSVNTRFSMVKIPISGKDRVRRLLTAEQFWMDEVHSTARGMIQKMVGIIGWLPWIIGDKMTHNEITDIGISCFPGIQGDIFLHENKVLEANFAVGTERGGTLAAAFTTLSSFGVLRFVMAVDKTVYPYEDVEQYFNEYIEKEIHGLLDWKEQNEAIAAPNG